jgi:HAMP domain-containing protein
VAGQLEDNRNMMARFTTGLAWASPAMLVLCALAGYFLNRRALQPVDQIAAMLRSINIGNLSHRLPVANTHGELQRLAETCNEMLAAWKTPSRGSIGSRPTRRTNCVVRWR